MSYNEYNFNAEEQIRVVESGIRSGRSGGGRSNISSCIV